MIYLCGINASPPTWGRGLKLSLRKECRPCEVAPHVGAWIETLLTYSYDRVNDVAPHVGAWIETREGAEERVKMLVAPHVGAWIETFLSSLV